MSDVEERDKMTYDEQLFEAVMCGIVHYSLEERPRVLNFNSACVQIYGYDSREEFRENVADSLEKMVYSYDVEFLRGFIRRAMGSGQTVNFGYRILRKNQTIGYIMGTMRVTRLNDGRNVLQSIFQDSGQHITQADIRKSIYYQSVESRVDTKKLILADIDAVSRHELGMILQDEYTVIEVDSGGEVLSVLEKEGEEISAVLITASMLVGQDYRFIAALRGSILYATIPIIALADLEMPIEDLLSYGVNEVVSKPYNVNVICMQLMNLIELRDTAVQRNTIEALMNNLSGGVLISRISEEGFIPTYFTDGVSKLSGMTKEETEDYINRKRWDDTIYEKDLDRLNANVSNAAFSGEPIEVTFRVVQKNGQLSWVHMHGTKIRNDGDAVIYQCILSPTTSSEKLYVDIMNDSFNGIIVYGEDKDDLLYFNNAAVPLLGEELLEAFAGETLSEKSYVQKQLLLPESGRHITINGKMIDWNGIKAKIIYITDDTESYLVQNEQLAAALTEAEQANKAKSMFLSRMSHDIRTPMNAILGMSNLALEKIGQQEAVQDYLKKILVSGSYLLGLINDILDMSRIESDRIQLDPKPYSIRECVDFVLVTLNMQMEEKNLKFSYVETGVMPEYVMLDKMRIQQVFFNLISNAVKFAKENGHVQVVVQPEEYEQGALWTTIQVRDDGIGIDKQDLEKIFEPFEQGSNQGTVKYQGSGLGLAIVKNLIRLMGGTISVESEEGAGTIFRMHMKLYPADALSVQGTDEQVILPEEYDFSNDLVLLVEDNAINMEIARNMLEHKNCQVRGAADGQEALDILEHSKPGEFQAVFMDMQMPVMDGLEATRKIRRSNRGDLAEIPIIAMTANAFKEDVRKSLEAGMDAHIAKPVDMKILYETLYRVLNRQEMGSDEDGK